MITRALDDSDGIILVTAIGSWSRADVDHHYAELRKMITVQREAGWPIRVLSDVTMAQRQGADLEQHTLRQMEETYLPGDRVAILVSPDEKTHVRGLLGNADVATFSPRLPAEMWLMEERLRPPA